MTRKLTITVLVLVSALAAAGAAQADPAWVITQRANHSTTQLTLNPNGLRFDFFAPVQSGGKLRHKHPKPFVAMIIRYRDGRLYTLDPVRRLYQVIALMSAIKTYDNELKVLAAAQPSVKLPPPPGRKPRRTQGPLKQPPATLQRLGLSMAIGPVRAQAFLLRQGTIRERIWYSAALPVPPANIASLLSQALTTSASGPLGRVMRAHSAQLPLRVDELVRSRWHTVLKTVSIVRRDVRASQFSPPRGYRKVNLVSNPGGKTKAHISDVPARPIRCGILVITLSLGCIDILSSFIPTVGPISEHPAIYAWYWGSAWKDHLDFVSAINHGLENMVGDQFADPSSNDFWGPLSQYGVHRGKLLGYSIEKDNPDASVGSWNFFDVAWFVFSHRWGTDAPHYWWRWSDEDPMFAIFIDGSKVDSSGWGGYHAFTPTESVFLAFMMHPAMPFFIVKTPALDSLGHSSDTPAWHAAVDQTTEAASHEFVETATDPYPFFSWADPLKEPIWENGEIGDICKQGDHSPYGEATRVAQYGTAFQPYWSTDANACVPNAQPDAKIVFPEDGHTYAWHSQVPFAIKTNSFIDNGPVADPFPPPGHWPTSTGSIRWNDDVAGQGFHTGTTFGDSKLSPGTHHITAVVTDSSGGQTIEGPITIYIHVVPPQVHIDYPSDFASFPADRKINFRGTVFDATDAHLGDSAVWKLDGTQIGTDAKLLRFNITTQGSHIVTLTATNGGGRSTTATVHVNITRPTGQPSVAITQPDNDSSFAAGSDITFKAVADASSGSNITGFTWRDHVDGALTGTGDTITTKLSGSICTIITHHVTVTATDNLNPPRTASDTITVHVGSIC